MKEMEREEGMREERMKMLSVPSIYEALFSAVYACTLEIVCTTPAMQVCAHLFYNQVGFKPPRGRSEK